MQKRYLPINEISALSLQALPLFEEFHVDEDALCRAISSPSYEGTYDLDRIQKSQTPVENVAELHDFVTKCGLPRFPLVFCRLEYAVAQVDAENQIPWGVIFMDLSKIKNCEELREIYIHECAHLIGCPHSHDLTFTALNNLYRAYGGYSVSTSDYDYRDVSSTWDMSMADAQTLTAALARQAIEDGASAKEAEEAILNLIRSRRDPIDDHVATVESFKLILSGLRREGN